MTEKTYEEAWAEDGEAAEAKANPLAAAKKAADAAEKDAYITAYDDIDGGKTANGEDLKDVKPNGDKQVEGTIVKKDADK
jgi:hypothetical protein